jgi:DEAD/DEAH box helicase domain-containing protein
VSSDNFVVVDATEGTNVIGETDFTSALTTLHPKAIYIVEGKLFQVEKLDFEGRKAYVREVDCDYYTDAITYSRVTVLDCFASSGSEIDAGGVAAHGEVHVVSRTVGFKKIKFYTNENVGSGELDLPEHQMHTTSFWLTIPPDVMTALPFDRDDRRDGVVGVAFAMGQVAQLLLMCDRHDIGISIGSAEAAGETRTLGRAAASSDAIDADHPRIFVYDNYPGGIGFSEPLFGMAPDLVDKTRGLIAGCPCESGCPSCVGPLGDTGPRAKAVALDILSRLPAIGRASTEGSPDSEWA